MANSKKELVTIEAKVNAPIEKVWDVWTGPEHIIKWNAPSEDWHTTSAENDLRIGGRFNSRMEAKDGSFGFDFSGVYNEVDEHERIVYTLDDGRKVWTTFTKIDGGTELISTFEAENENPIEMQKAGWQSILNSFKNYSETPRNWVKLKFDVNINAPIETVYSKMISKDSYSQWTAEFNPTSSFKGSWDKGSKILFVGCDAEGNEEGMVSRIKENIPNKFISIKFTVKMESQSLHIIPSVKYPFTTFIPKTFNIHGLSQFYNSTVITISGNYPIVADSKIKWKTSTFSTLNIFQIKNYFIVN